MNGASTNYFFPVSRKRHAPTHNCAVISHYEQCVLYGTPLSIILGRHEVIAGPFSRIRLTNPRLFSAKSSVPGRIKAVDRPGDFLDHCGTLSLFDKCLGNGPLRCFGKGFSKRPGDHAITLQRRAKADAPDRAEFHDREVP